MFVHKGNSITQLDKKKNNRNTKQYSQNSWPFYLFSLIAFACIIY